MFQTVIEQTTRIAVAAPRGPKRSAAHNSTGKTMDGTSRCAAVGEHREHDEHVALHEPRRRKPFQPIVAQVSTAGATTRHR